MPFRIVFYSNSDKLINSLIDKEYIFTSTVEKAVRAVSSKLFDCKLRSRRFNYLSPCVSYTVLECLVIRPGHKFLNIGSENGYFNTLAGLLLGSTGVNHGIEVDKALVDIANQKMDNFKLNSAAIDYNVFCEPVFIHGNACQLVSTSFYDRVYCRPGVPPEHIEFMKSLIKIGGVLVMPLENCLVRITRIDELRFDTTELFKVKRTDLIVPEGSVGNKIEFPPIAPVSLKDLCRIAIRSLFHENIIKEFPDMDIFTKCKIVSNPEKKIFGLRDTLSESIRSEFNLNEEQIFYFRFPLDTFDVADEFYSDSNSDTENDISNHHYQDCNVEKYDNNKLDGEEIHKNSYDKIINDDNKQDDGEKDKVTDDTKIDHDNKLDNQETGDDNKLDGEIHIKIDNDKEVGCSKDAEKEKDVTPVYTSTELSKIKSPEAGCSRSALEMENKKKMKTDSSTEEITSVPSTSPVAKLHRSPSVSVYKISDESGEFFYYDNEDYNDLIRDQFQNDCKQNKLSLLLKDKIDSLPLPGSLKMYLNYYRSD